MIIMIMVSDYDDDQSIMMITKQSLPSSRQVQLATRLTAGSVAQVQLRPAQGGLRQNITEEATACHTGKYVRELS